MKLNMYVIGDQESCVNWICATNEKEAITIFQNYYGEVVWQEYVESSDDASTYIREMDQSEPFTYYHDGVRPESNTIGYFLNTYCTKPDIFAVSEF